MSSPTPSPPPSDGRRGSWRPVPVLRLGAGPLAPDTLDSFRLVPAALENAGYTFEDRDVSEVIAAALRSKH